MFLRRPLWEESKERVIVVSAYGDDIHPDVQERRVISCHVMLSRLSIVVVAMSTMVEFGSRPWSTIVNIRGLVGAATCCWIGHVLIVWGCS